MHTRLIFKLSDCERPLYVEQPSQTPVLLSEPNPLEPTLPLQPPTPLTQQHNGNANVRNHTLCDVTNPRCDVKRNGNMARDPLRSRARDVHAHVVPLPLPSYELPPCVCVSVLTWFVSSVSLRVRTHFAHEI